MKTKMDEEEETEALAREETGDRIMRSMGY
jgi:hypothetical protein